jgi:class 3 adenylate cyclase
MPAEHGVTPEHLKELLSGVDLEQLEQIMPLVGGAVITMMFTDIVDSTRVKREVGDPVYFTALGQHNRAIRECIARYAGQIRSSLPSVILPGRSNAPPAFKRFWPKRR